MALFGLGGSKTTVGLDIGSGLIKVVSVNHGKGEPVLAKVGVAPVLQDAIVEGEIMDPGVVGDAIRSALEAAGLKQKRVVAAVGGRDVIIKKIQVDRMKESDAADVVRWEAQQHVPFDIEGVQLDFQVLDPEGEGVQMDVLLVAAKRELVENRAALLTDAGLDPAIVDVDAFALHNAFEVNYPEAMQGVAAMIHIGHEVTNVNILQDGVPLLTRDLSVGTRKFREDLQRERGMSAEDADRLLQGFERSPDLDPFVKNRGEEIGVGVERAGAFLASASRDAGQIQRLYCSGGGARIPGLADTLGERLRLPIEVADPIKGLTVKDDAFGSLALDEVAPLLMLAVGLALRKLN
ncbi:MAG: type IV pilus assembly protein PilM [Gemmatimonadetes bacterium]|nr:type IV pilus assembly protein PilM [Gemmatimonadota bacterium]MBI2402873.1 type IV pilus assembly protein PilM [Gemmatimonadota bacterium]MBI2536576.1 type IV pilus assembly protein PilM [Gemmatimonadota bacterium]